MHRTRARFLRSVFCGGLKTRGSDSPDSNELEYRWTLSVECFGDYCGFTHSLTFPGLLFICVVTRGEWRRDLLWVNRTSGDELEHLLMPPMWRVVPPLVVVVPCFTHSITITNRWREHNHPWRPPLPRPDRTDYDDCVCLDKLRQKGEGE